MIDRDKHGVVVFKNMVSPYTNRLFNDLIDAGVNLKVASCVEQEANRIGVDLSAPPLDPNAVNAQDPVPVPERNLAVPPEGPPPQTTCQLPALAVGKLPAP